jgi:hypothetical protein
MTPDRRYVASMEAAKDIIDQMAAGHVIRFYDIDTDGSAWIYGPHRWPVLIENGHGVPGDPALGRQTFPIADWYTYLSEFYWPNRRRLHGRHPRAVDVEP